ncbi:MAG: NifB/NifX family molybdenum-iron cluster-binding protein [Infirmifilum sp.]|jgi:predicted Fe-Mo cluster-binding NifX family protein|uniref:NifB/NifX family molybdenum-iron cluster-binding protein n=1 Tax=Infirmifilum sp. TaxID=2856575 RepID=UPI003D0CD6CD
MKIAIPVVKSGEKYFLVPHFGRAPAFAIVDVGDSQFKVLEVYQNIHAAHEHGKVSGLFHELLSREVQAILTMGIGYGAFYRLKDLGLKIFYVRPSPGKATISLEEAVENFISGKVEEAGEPKEADDHHN